MLYIDTSVLLVYTLTQAVERARYRYTEKFFAKVIDGSLSVATSFYALHEVYVFAIDNAPNFQVGTDYGKAALEKILALPLQILPLVTRGERTRHARMFSALRVGPGSDTTILTIFPEPSAATNLELKARGLRREAGVDSGLFPLDINN